MSESDRLTGLDARKAVLRLDARKAALRREAAALRAAAAKADPESAARLASHGAALRDARLFGEANIIAEYIIAGYWPIRSEIDPIPLLEVLAAMGFKTALPATPRAGEPLVFHLWESGDALIDGLYGTSEPLATAPQCQPDGLLVPLLAFDSRFFRLGYGGGFYDRSLAVLRRDKPHMRAVGIAYRDQQVEDIPTGSHDARLDAVLTPDGLIVAGERD